MEKHPSPSTNPTTQPILISGSDQDIQFGDVTIGPDGRTYITWSQIIGELEGTPQTFVHKLRIASAGPSTSPSVSGATSAPPWVNRSPHSRVRVLPS